MIHKKGTALAAPLKNAFNDKLFNLLGVAANWPQV
jgi:hypothetical protein